MYDWENSTDAIIYMNTSVGGALDGATRPRQSEVFIHELGHVLKLAHPKSPGNLMPVSGGRGHYGDGNTDNTANDNIIVSLMNQGSSWSNNNLACVYPKWHDKINLKNKWGN